MVRPSLARSSSRYPFAVAVLGGLLVLGTVAGRDARGADEEVPFGDTANHFSLSTPKAWKTLNAGAIAVPGEVSQAWTTPAKDVVVAFVQKPGQAISPRALLDASTNAVKQQLQAEVATEEVKTVAGKRAMWLVFTAKGTGQGIDGKGDVPTTQEWVAIPREKDVVVLLLTAPAERFKAASKAFGEMLKSLKVEGTQTKEQADAK